jgi:Ca2+-binding EF-hand superfamily protein
LPKPEREPTEEEKEKARKIADPDGTGKITFESFRTLSLAAIEEGKKRGKL